MLKVKVKKTLEAFHALQAANVPIEIVEQIAGEAIRVDKDFNYSTLMAGVRTKWALPPSTVEIQPL